MVEPPNKGVPNFPPYKAMRGASDNFNQYIEKLGTVVNNARRSHGTSANKHLWDGFDATLEKIDIARTGDHGPYLIKEAEETLGKKGFDIKRQKVGINPISNPRLSGKQWTGRPLRKLPKPRAYPMWTN